MSKVLQLTAVVEREGDGYVATCAELDIVSQGRTVEEARRNLVEAVVRQSGLPRSLFEIE
jgi:hypothetical protein